MPLVIIPTSRGVCVCVCWGGGGGGGAAAASLHKLAPPQDPATKEYYISVKIDTSEIECFTSSFSTKALTTL